MHRQLTGKGRGGEARQGDDAANPLAGVSREQPGRIPVQQFCDLSWQWRGQVDVVRRQNYRAGEKVFVDYAGPKFEVIDRSSGEALEVMVFVGVLAAWVARQRPARRLFHWAGGLPAKPSSRPRSTTREGTTLSVHS